MCIFLDWMGHKDFIVARKASSCLFISKAANVICYEKALIRSNQIKINCIRLETLPYIYHYLRSAQIRLRGIRSA